MAKILNASSAYISAGGGNNYKIYDSASSWVQLQYPGYTPSMFFHDNGDGTAQIVGGAMNGVLTLPNGVVANGYQTFSNGWSQGNSISDGSNQLQLGLYYPNGYGAPIDNYQIANWTINIRRTS